MLEFLNKFKLIKSYKNKIMHRTAIYLLPMHIIKILLHLLSLCLRQHICYLIYSHFYIYFLSMHAWVHTRTCACTHFKNLKYLQFQTISPGFFLSFFHFVFVCPFFYSKNPGSTLCLSTICM